MVFITTAFGTEYIRLNLPSYLGSLIDTHLGSEVYIFLDEKSIKDDFVSNCITRAKYKGLKVSLVSIDGFGRQVLRTNSRSKVAATKVKLWNEALKYVEKEQNKKTVCVTDLDVIFLKNLESDVNLEFQNRDMSNGCLFTFYDKLHKAYDPEANYITGRGNPRVNSGVMFFTTVKAGIEMTKGWLSITEDILHRGSPLKLEYMAEDQDALVLLYWSEFIKSNGHIPIPSYFEGTVNILNNLQIAGTPCRKYNEPESIGEITEDTKIVHFKGGWQNIILQASKGKPLKDISYSIARSFNACNQQILKWLHFRDSLVGDGNG